MADTNTPSRPPPRDWNAAFATLPLERAPVDAWARLSTALPQPMHEAAAAPRASVLPRPRVRAGLAAAASVAFALPVAWWLGMSPDAPMRAPAPGGAEVASPMRTSPPVTRDLASDAAPVEAASQRSASAASATARDVPVDRSKAAATVPRTIMPVRPDAATALHGVQDGSHAMPAAIAASTPEAGAGAAREPDGGSAASARDEAARLAELRRESARLEALVAYARNDSMASAPVAVMSASIDDRIRLIDTALMQPGIGDLQRSSLWSERVDALRELASLEGTQRWMAAHGASMDAVARVD